MKNVWQKIRIRIYEPGNVKRKCKKLNGSPSYSGDNTIDENRVKKTIYVNESVQS